MHVWSWLGYSFRHSMCLLIFSQVEARVLVCSEKQWLEGRNAILLYKLHLKNKPQNKENQGANHRPQLRTWKHSFRCLIFHSLVFAQWKMVVLYACLRTRGQHQVSSSPTSPSLCLPPFLPSFPSSFWSLSDICSADFKVPFPGLCSTSPLLALKNKVAGPVKTDKEKTTERVRSFDSPLPCLLSCFRGVPWVCVISAQNVFLTHNDQHECASVSIYSAEVTCHGWFMSLFSHVSLQAGQQASGWMGSANLPIYYSCQLWKVFFSPLPYERPISNESVKWRRQLICEFRFCKVTGLWWAAQIKLPPR